MSGAYAIQIFVDVGSLFVNSAISRQYSTKKASHVWKSSSKIVCPSKKVELLEQDPNYKILGKMISHDEKTSACFRLIISSCIEIFVELGGTKCKMEVSRVSKLSSKCLFTYIGT